MAIGRHVVVARVDEGGLAAFDVEHGGAENVARVVSLDLQLVVHLNLKGEE